ncbi:hypothetical protein GCM10010399_19970 [Dactylosporangium fulvum]|uniref:Sensor-like histidine kinase SenX3 n=1 Tax=Dactylosporangium fulvum TaxID=53359 RepID=A0ABY5W4Q9_9ACTN|nr:PAS domain-containing sensor histidine kinase [Dactylosporangium fulvum]UWP83698.1 PAS domain S-box protein [Dactylosporangium fulvum]
MGVRLQVTGVVLLGLLASGGLGLLMHRVERDHAGQVLDRRVAAAQDAVVAAGQRYVDVLRLTAGALEALPEVDADGFTVATAPVGQLWLPGAASVDFVAAVPDSGVAAAQADWRERGVPGLMLTPAQGLVRHYFPVLRRTIDATAAGAAPPGTDLGASSQVTGAVERAERVGLPAVSQPFAEGGEERPVVMLQRVLDRSDGALRGFVAMTVHLPAFFAGTMPEPSGELRAMTLGVLDGSGLRPVARIDGTTGGDDLRRSVAVQVADQRWQLDVVAGGEGYLDEGMFLAGLALTLVTALLVSTLATSRRRAEERVAEATAELRVAGAVARQQATLRGAAMDTIGDGVLVIDRHGKVLWLNPTARAILGPEAAGHLASEWPELLDIREMDAATRHRLRNLLNAGRESQVECVIRGRRIDVRLRSLVQDGEPAGAVAVLRDVTDSNAAAEQLRASEELLQVLLDGARDYAIYLLDPHGAVVTWSANAERLMGYRSEEVIDGPYDRFFTAEDAAEGLPRRLLAEAAERGRVEIDGPRVRKDRSVFWTYGLITAVRNTDGSVRGFVNVSQDVSNRKAADLVIERLNADLEQRVEERTADLESFSYSVSHDLRAPLRAIDGFAKMLALEHGDALDEQGRRYLGRIRAGAQRMGELIDGLLAFSRLQRQELTNQRVRLDDLVADVWDELTIERGDRDIVLTVGELPDALGDPRLIRHVVANLLGNAVKYTRDVSSARIEVGHKVTAGGDATYFVRDNGTGFDMRYADKLFKVFQRLHRAEDYEGTGIGLALAHRIVQRHGGQIWADATPGDGATFYFTLPADMPALEVVSP